MKVYDAASIRNVALIGHSGSGKTQLASAALFDAGMVNRFGKVDDGTTVTDFDEEEVIRKHTLSATPAYAEWNKTKINLIDTPGIGNFLADARAALRVVDAAVLVVDAVAGVEVQTEKVWEAATELALPRLIVVNRIDRERASLDRTLQSLRDVCSRTIVPIQLPIGEEKSFRGVVDLVTMKALVYQTDGSGNIIYATDSSGNFLLDSNGEGATGEAAIAQYQALAAALQGVVTLQDGYYVLDVPTLEKKLDQFDAIFAELEKLGDMQELWKKYPPEGSSDADKPAQQPAPEGGAEPAPGGK